MCFELFMTSPETIHQALTRGATIITPFIVLSLFKAHGVAGVLALVIGLLILQIIVVAVWGIEPAKRGLEDLETAPGRSAA